MAERKRAPVRVCLGDDHPLLLAGFAMSLKGFGIDVVGEASSVEEAIEKYEALRPEVLVLDIRFGDQPRGGLEAAKRILEHHPEANIVFLSQFDTDSLISQAYKIGGRAFVTKDTDPADLAEAIEQARDGKTYFLPAVAERLAVLSIRGPVLDEREEEVLKLMALGLTNAEIAEKLNLSPKTISNTSQSLKDKLNVSRTAEITRHAVKQGLIEP